MRIRVSEFKRIVREEASRMHKVDEVDGDTGASLESLIEPVLQQLAESWNDMYDDEMAVDGLVAGNRKSWMIQCERATEELQLKITEAVDEIEQRLMDGEFYQG